MDPELLPPYLRYLAAPDATRVGFTPNPRVGLGDEWKALQQFATEGPFGAQLLAGAVPGVGESMDLAAFEAARAAGDRSGMAFAAGGALVPWVGGSAIKAALAPLGSALKQGWHQFKDIVRLADRSLFDGSLQPFRNFTRGMDYASEAYAEATTRYERALSAFMEDPDAFGGVAPVMETRREIARRLLDEIDMGPGRLYTYLQPNQEEALLAAARLIERGADLPPASGSAAIREAMLGNLQETMAYSDELPWSVRELAEAEAAVERQIDILNRPARFSEIPLGEELPPPRTPSQVREAYGIEDPGEVYERTIREYLRGETSEVISPSSYRDVAMESYRRLEAEVAELDEIITTAMREMASTPRGTLVGDRLSDFVREAREKKSALEWTIAGFKQRGGIYP